MMNQQEINQLALALSEQVQKNHADFWIDAEKHYNDHIKFCGWVKFFEETQKDIVIAVRRTLITAGFIALGWGIYLSGIFTNGG